MNDTKPTTAISAAEVTARLGPAGGRMSACIFCPTTHPCTDASHALHTTEAIVSELRGILHGMSMSRDHEGPNAELEDGMLMAVGDFIDDIDEKRNVIDAGYRAAVKQLKEYRHGEN